MKIPLDYNCAQPAAASGLDAAHRAGDRAGGRGVHRRCWRWRTDSGPRSVKTGSAQNVLVLRRGADSELSSGIDRASRQHHRVVAPHRDRGTDGRPLFSPETYIVITSRGRAATDGVANVVVRGIRQGAWTVRRNIQIMEGRTPESGRAEICVGAKIAGRFDHTGTSATCSASPAGTGTSSAASPPTARLRVGDLGRERAVQSVFRGERLPGRRVPAQGSRRRSRT